MKKIIEEITFGSVDLENEGNAKNESSENDNPVLAKRRHL